MHKTLEYMQRFFSTTSIRGVVAFLTVILSFSCLFVLYFHPIPEGNQRLADITTGFVLGTAVAAVYQYLYGSSKTETDKRKASEELK